MDYKLGEKRPKKNLKAFNFLWSDEKDNCPWSKNNFLHEDSF